MIPDHRRKPSLARRTCAVLSKPQHMEGFLKAAGELIERQLRAGKLTARVRIAATSRFFAPPYALHSDSSLQSKDAPPTSSRYWVGGMT
jgi:hypothetical protein